MDIFVDFHAVKIHKDTYWIYNKFLDFWKLH